MLKWLPSSSSSQNQETTSGYKHSKKLDELIESLKDERNIPLGPPSCREPKRWNLTFTSIRTPSPPKTESRAVGNPWQSMRDPAEPQSQRPSRFSGLVSHEPTASQKHECIERSESPCPLCERDYKKLYLEEREARERLEKEYERLKASRENCAKCEIRTYQKMIDKFYRKIQYVLQNERLSLFQRYDSLCQMILDPEFKTFVDSSNYQDNHYSSARITNLVKCYPKSNNALVHIINEVRRELRYLRSHRVAVFRINNIIKLAIAERAK